MARATAVIERWLEVQRDQLPLWLPVVSGAGAGAWFGLPDVGAWVGWLALMLAIALAGLAFPRDGRARQVLLIAGIAGALGLSAAWWRADSVAAPVLDRPVVVSFTATVTDVELQVARERVRVTLAPDVQYLVAPGLTRGRASYSSSSRLEPKEEEALARIKSGPTKGGNIVLPPKVRVTIPIADAPERLASGDRLKLRARLVPPPHASIPGGYDFSRGAWFMRLGATGSALGSVERIGAIAAPGFRERLSAHVRDQIPGSAGGIAAAFATGDRGGIAVEDEEAMRASGLTHLLSISGLHVTAVVGAGVLIALRLLALSRWMALRLPLIVISAGVGAGVGVGYTLLTGAEVPTVRSCIAACLILVGVALGRQAFTLRLVASGAIFVLLLWPESIVGPSFQLSFAAITSIVALYEWPPVARLVAVREESVWIKGLRFVGGLLLTGIVVEVALAPIALYHFHRQGLYGALANIIAIPLTTFVTMPLEALALLFDLVGAGAPFWWATGKSLELLLWIARVVAAWPGAMAALPSVPLTAYLMMVGGGLWTILWRGRVRALGFGAFGFGAFWSFALPPPDLIVTGDGVHMGLRSDDGRLVTLRPRAGDYVRDTMAERFGDLGELGDLDAMPGAVCTADVCRADVTRGGRNWRIVATRTRYFLPRPEFAAECAAADIVISDRRLPPWCRPRWLRADRTMLAATGGLAITLSTGRVERVADGEGAHPWVLARAAQMAPASR